MLDLELGKTAYKIVEKICNVKKGESVLITVDGPQEWRLAEETAKAAEAVGAKVMVAWHSTLPGYGKIGEHMLPDPLKAALPHADLWIEFNDQWILYSEAWVNAINHGRVRYLSLTGLDAQTMIRCIRNVDIELQARFQDHLVKITKNQRTMRITTRAGTDVSFENDPKRPIINELFATTPGPHFLLGQIGWAPIEESINGTIVYDGSYSGGGEANLGILETPIKLEVKNGDIRAVKGGKEAAFLKKWLAKFNDPNMYKMAHICYGFNPGAKLSGRCSEDERVWGCTEWGNGFQGMMFTEGKVRSAASHGDGICLKSTVWFNQEKIMEDGKLYEPELAKLAVEIGKQ